jgi:hypothetical protein
MKKIILLLSLLLLFLITFSCEKNCDDEEARIHTDFQERMMIAAEQGNENQLELLERQYANALEKACD